MAWESHENSTASRFARRPPSEIRRPPPPALAAAHLRARSSSPTVSPRPGSPLHIRHGGAIPGHSAHVLRITHWTNDGAAFSLFADSASPNTVRWVFDRLLPGGRSGRARVLVRLGNRFTLTTVALALVFAGALGNVHDRILYGSVVDFIEVHIFSYHFPDFNVADSSIVTGACLLMLDSLLPQRKQESRETSAARRAYRLMRPDRSGLNACESAHSDDRNRCYAKNHFAGCGNAPDVPSFAGHDLSRAVNR